MVVRAAHVSPPVPLLVEPPLDPIEPDELVLSPDDEDDAEGSGF